MTKAPTGPASSVTLTSDNACGASPQILAALSACNDGALPSYGADAITQRVEARLTEIFERPVSMFLVATGSAANALCLAALTPPWGSVLCHPESHINVDECGAPEMFTAGAKLVAIDGDAAKPDMARLAVAARRQAGDVHSVQPKCISITQATETGNVYSVTEVEAIGALCQETGLKLHMDGARFANALVSTGATPAEMTWQAGVDALSFGATKNGALAAEAIVLFDGGLADEMRYRRKRSGHLFSKMRLLSAQFEAYLIDDLWLVNARHANAMAQRLDAGLRAMPGVTMAGATQANILFCTLPPQVIEQLQSAGFQFYTGRWAPGEVRLVTSFMTREDEIDAFLAATKAALG